MYGFLEWKNSFIDRANKNWRQPKMTASSTINDF